MEKFCNTNIARKMKWDLTNNGEKNLMQIRSTLKPSVDMQKYRREEQPKMQKYDKFSFIC